MEKAQRIEEIELNLPKQRVYFVRTPAFKRMISFIVDLFLFDFVIGPMKSIFNSYSTAFSISSISYPTDQNSYAILASMTIFIGFLFFLYNFMFQYYLGQTPGMMLINIRLVNTGAVENALKKGIVPSFKKQSALKSQLKSVNPFQLGKKLSSSFSESSSDDIDDSNISGKNRNQKLSGIGNEDNVGTKEEKHISALPTASQIVLRNMIFIPILPFVIFWIIDPLHMIFKKERFIDKFIKIGVVEQLGI